MKNAGISILCCILMLFASVTLKILFIEYRNDDYLNSETENIKVYLTDNNEYINMNLEDYVLCVLRGEMPSDFELEALKAQAVAIRTYTIKKIGANNEVHPESPVCNNFEHCMAFVDEDKAKLNWGNNFTKNNEKLIKAVYDTKGEIITYNNEPITAVFHAISSGKTENSNEVWQGPEIPYLKSVESLVDIGVTGYNSSVKVPKKEFLKKLDIKYFSDILYTYTDGGSVKTIKIAEKEFKGYEIRKVFGLRSNNFSIQLNDEMVTFNVKGYGHGVGMSQRGANEYAKQGLTYDEILKKYYTDIKIIKQGS